MYRKQNMKLILILKVNFLVDLWLMPCPSTGPKMVCASPKNVHTFCAKPNDDFYSVNLVFVLASNKFAARVLPSLNSRQFLAVPL